MKLALSIFLSTIACAFSQGVFVYKNQSFHDDSGAHAFIYTSISEQYPVTWVVKSGERIRFEKHQFHKWIQIRAALPTELVTDAQIMAFRSEVAEVVVFFNRFKCAQPLMQKSLDSMNQVIAKLNDGQLLYQKQWISRKDYELVIEKARLAAESVEREKTRLLNEKILADAKLKEEERQVKADAEALVEKNKEFARQTRELVREQRIGEVEKSIMSVKSEIRTVEGNQSNFIDKLNQLLTDQ